MARVFPLNFSEQLLLWISRRLFEGENINPWEFLDPYQTSMIEVFPKIVNF